MSENLQKMLNSSSHTPYCVVNRETVVYMEGKNNVKIVFQRENDNVPFKIVELTFNEVADLMWGILRELCAYAKDKERVEKRYAH